VGGDWYSNKVIKLLIAKCLEEKGIRIAKYRIKK
jgi:hypothetical protein